MAETSDFCCEDSVEDFYGRLFVLRVLLKIILTNIIERSNEPL